jgi:hypothetical protein
MALVRHPNLQTVNGKYAEGATVTAVTNRDTLAAADAYEDEGGVTPVSYPVTAGSEGDVDLWVPVGAYESTFGDDTVDTPAVWEAISGEELADMLTVDDIPGFPSNVFSPITYGGDPTGVADSTEAIRDAIAAAAAVEGTVDFGNGSAVWDFSEQLYLPSGVRLTSSASNGRGARGARLRFNGDGSDTGPSGTSNAAIFIDSKQRVEIDHLWFEYTNTAFTGPLMHWDGTGTDVINCHMHHCNFDSQAGIATLTAQCMLLMQDVILSEVSECRFDGGANNLIQLGDPTSGGFNNQVSINNCAFADILNHDRGQIGIYGSIQAVVIDTCSFEGAGLGILPIRGSNSTLDAEDTRDNLIYSMTVSNCWAGDVVGGFANGLNGLGDWGPVLFMGNFISSASGNKIFTAGENGCAFVAIGNHIAQGLSVFGSLDTGSANYSFHEGFGRNPLPLWDTGDGPQAYTRMSRDQSHATGYLGFRSQTEFDDMATWDEGDQLVIGGTVPSATGLISPTSDQTCVVYTRAIGTANSLALQAARESNNCEVQMVAGTTPAAKVRASGNGVAFNGTAPIAKPTGVGVDAASIHAALVSLGLISA